MQPAPGDTLAGWIVERQLGAGAMGAVWRCHHPDHPQQRAAIKLLGNEDMPDAHLRFQREAEVLARLDHPGIARFLSYQDHPPALVMEFVEGDNLLGWLGEGLSTEAVVSIVAQVAHALDHVHKQGVWHRDVKPENIIIPEDGRVRLVDFGIAVSQEWQRLTATGLFLGTLPYVPPEALLTDDTLDPQRWDIYSLGVIFYELLSGQLAFTNPAGKRAPAAVVNEKDLLPWLDPGTPIPDPLRTLVRDTTCADPQQRIPTAAVFLARLQDAVGQDLGLHNLSPTKPLPSPKKPPVTVSPSLGAPPNTVQPPNAADIDLSDVIEPVDITPSNAIEPTNATIEPTGVTITQAAERSPSTATQCTSPATPSRNIDPTQLTQQLPRGRGRRWWLPLVGVGPLLLAGGFGIGAILGAALVLLTTPSSPPPSPPQVVVAGVPSDTPLQVTVAGQRPTVSDGAIFQFEDLPDGAHPLRVVVGDCGTPSCCKQISQTRSWSPNDRVTVVSVGPLPSTQPRPVQLALPGVSRAVIELGGNRARVTSDGWVFGAVPPGHYQLLVELGRCPAEAGGCAATQSCPDGCVSSLRPIEVPCGKGVHTITLDDLDTPNAPNTPSQASRIVPDDPVDDEVIYSPAAQATAAPLRQAGPRVTRADFAAWVREHREWNPRRAVARNQADAGYLATWQGNTPSGQASHFVGAVSYLAAKAYCQPHGGVASVDDGPWEWFEDGAPLAELRSDDGTSVVRFGQGATRKHSPVTTHPRIGFRCHR